MKNKMVNMLPIVALCLFLASCAESKQVAYLQNAHVKDTGNLAGVGSTSVYEARFKPKDIVFISVATSEAQASRNYNLVMPQITSSALNNMLYTVPTLQNYLVDNNGFIDFPVFGKIKIINMTRMELENILHEKLQPAFSKERPIITIRITNYSVNVLGEVTRPGKYQCDNERMTIFEGLAMAGDMTIYGKRNSVKVLREHADGSKEIFFLNLNDKKLVQSPAYFLEQNDVVYVEPNKSKSKSSGISSAENLSVSALTVVISLASLIVNVLR